MIWIAILPYRGALYRGIEELYSLHVFDTCSLRLHDF